MKMSHRAFIHPLRPRRGAHVRLAARNGCSG
jgi:hypothetical protein